MVAPAWRAYFVQCRGVGATEALVIVSVVSPGVLAKPVLTAQSARSDLSWMLAERIVRMVVGMLASVLVARHLGPADFGRLSMALSIQGIFAVVAAAGVDDLVVRTAVGGGVAAQGILQSAIRLKFAASCLSVLGALIAGALWQPDDPKTMIAVVLTGMGLLFTPWDAIYFWCLGRGRMAEAGFVRIIVLVAAGGARIGLVIIEAPLVAFAAVFALEACASAALLYRIGLDDVPLGRLLARRLEGIMPLVREGLPLVSSSLLVVLTMQLDRLMLIRIAGQAEAGVYAAGVRLTESLHAVPVVLASAMIPRLAAARALGTHWEVARRFTVLWCLCGLGAGLILMLGARGLIPVLFGAGFAGAVPVLSWHGWSLVFIGLVSLRTRLLIFESRADVVLLLAVVTLGLCAVFNLAFIPRMGAQGCAVATVLTWIVSAVVIPWIPRTSRRIMATWLGWRREGQ